MKRRSLYFLLLFVAPFHGLSQLVPPEQLVHYIPDYIGRFETAENPTELGLSTNQNSYVTYVSQLYESKNAPLERYQLQLFDYYGLETVIERINMAFVGQYPCNCKSKYLVDGNIKVIQTHQGEYLISFYNRFVLSLHKQVRRNNKADNWKLDWRWSDKGLVSDILRQKRLSLLKEEAEFYRPEEDPLLALQDIYFDSTLLLYFFPKDGIGFKRYGKANFARSFTEDANPFSAQRYIDKDGKLLTMYIHDYRSDTLRFNEIKQTFPQFQTVDVPGAYSQRITKEDLYDGTISYLGGRVEANLLVGDSFYIHITGNDISQGVFENLKSFIESIPFKKLEKWQL